MRAPLLLLAFLLVACRPVAAKKPVESPRTDAPAEGPLRFVVLGDTGKGNPVQFDVGRAMAQVCELKGGCQFALLLGDNIYQTGVTDVDDPQWQQKFELPFAPDRFPFWVALGNHDYGADGAGWEYWKADPQVAYSKKSAKWRMPARHYSFREGLADFYAIDTNAIFWKHGQDQEPAIDAWMQRAKGPWRMVFGHHPYLSNGRHGNAGHYDGVPAEWMPGAGGEMKAFAERHILGKADVFFGAHDHTLQDLGEVQGTTLVISGAGSSPTALGGTNPAHFQYDHAGFLYVELTAREMQLHFYDAAAKELFQRTVAHR